MIRLILFQQMQIFYSTQKDTMIDFQMETHQNEKSKWPSNLNFKLSVF